MGTYIRNDKNKGHKQPINQKPNKMCLTKRQMKNMEKLRVYLF